jgi:DivIVA domain-containing protein
MSVVARVDERLTPDRVQPVSFPQARLGRRGLDEDHVRAFCAHVERELVTLLNEARARIRAGFAMAQPGRDSDGRNTI